MKIQSNLYNKAKFMAY